MDLVRRRPTAHRSTRPMLLNPHRSISLRNLSHPPRLPSHLVLKKTWGSPVGRLVPMNVKLRPLVSRVVSLPIKNPHLLPIPLHRSSPRPRPRSRPLIHPPTRALALDPVVESSNSSLSKINPPVRPRACSLPPQELVKVVVHYPPLIVDLISRSDSARLPP